MLRDVRYFKAVFYLGKKMADLKITYFEKQDLALINVIGDVTVDDFMKGMEEYYKKITIFLICDFTNANISTLTTHDSMLLSKKSKKYTSRRKGKKTAFIFPSDLGFGLGRKLQTIFELEGNPVELRIFRNIQEAKEWLGIKGKIGE